MKTFASRADLDAFLTAYEARRRGDRERLDAIIRYAQATECRVRIIARYFAEPVERDCGACDNCRAHAAGRFERPRSPEPREPVARVERARFERGAWVTHRTFGRGEVVAADADSVTVVFERVGEKRVDSGYLTPIEADPAASNEAA